MGIRATQAEAAKEFGVKRQAIHSLIKRGRLALDDDGKLDMDLARAVIATMSPAKSKAAARLAGGAPAPQDVPAPAAGASAGAATTAPADGEGEASPTAYHVARTLSEKYRALNERAEYLERTGKLVDADQVRQIAFARARAARDALMALPARLAAVLAAESDAGKCHELMAAEIRRICGELSSSAEQPIASAK